MNPQGRPEIQDEFTSLPISRRRKWQLRKIRDGWCSKCGKEKLVNATVGKRCLEKARKARKQSDRALALLKEYRKAKASLKKSRNRLTLRAATR